VGGQGRDDVGPRVGDHAQGVFLPRGGEVFEERAIGRRAVEEVQHRTERSVGRDV